jgi:2-oxoglutarate ferredoxin oxidoreductase subunit gamma
MQNETIIAGFGGQGVLFAGKLLAHAGLHSGYEVTWLPSYGPEMRGGTANCTVIIADSEIGSPQVRNPSAAIVLNQPSLDKYEPLVKEGGYLVINQSMVNRFAHRKDLHIITIPGTEDAEALGDKRLTNMVLLGGLVKSTGYITLDAIEEALKKESSEKQLKLLELNVKALRKGAEYSASKD